MSDFLQTGAAFLNSQLQGSCSEAVTYNRGASSIKNLPATLGSQLLKRTDRLGNVILERTDRDFIFAAALLVIGGVTITPASGDTIDLPLNGVTYRYAVTPYNHDPAWRYCDPMQTMIRVHTKFLQTV